MASQIASEFTEATYSLYLSSLIYVGLILFGITIIISLMRAVSHLAVIERARRRV